MISCPNCGTENPAERAICQLCGEPLPAAPPRKPEEAAQVVDRTDASDELDWLLADDPPAPTTPQPDPTPAPMPPAEPPARPSNAFVPDWLQGTEMEAPPPEPELEWDEDLDFSDLPEWEVDPEVGQVEPPSEAPRGVGRTTPTAPIAYEPFTPGDPIQSAESMGSGLLTGVRGPIPVEPIVRVSHDVPDYAQNVAAEPVEDAAALWAQIAGGGVISAPVVPRVKRRGRFLLAPLLLLALIIGTLLMPNLTIFGAPPPLPAATAYADTIAALPPNSTVLLAFEYEGGLIDEMEPAAIATLRQLRAVADGGRLLVVSTNPQGPALADAAWRASGRTALAGMPPATRPVWVPIGYQPGGTIAIRSLLASALPGPGTTRQLDLLIVFGNEANDVQLWVEQVGIMQPTLPILAAAPATAEATLAPYLRTAQVDGLLAGVPSVASYELYGLGEQDGPAWRRLDALTLAALFTLLVIVVGNLQGLRQRRVPADQEETPDAHA